MDFRVRKDDGSDILLHSTSQWNKKIYDERKRNVNPTFFKKTQVLAHHGVKGMKWSVHNEETKQKYGETGAGLEGGGGGMLPEDEEIYLQSDESRKEENQGVLSPDQIQQMKECEERMDERGIQAERVKEYQKADIWKTHPIGEHIEYSYRNKYDHKIYPLDADTVEKGKFGKEIPITEQVHKGSVWNEGKDGYDEIYEDVTLGKTKKRGSK